MNNLNKLRQKEELGYEDNLKIMKQIHDNNNSIWNRPDEIKKLLSEGKSVSKIIAKPFKISKTKEEEKKSGNFQFMTEFMNKGSPEIDETDSYESSCSSDSRSLLSADKKRNVKNILLKVGSLDQRDED